MCVCNVIGAYIDPFQARPTRTLGPGETDDVTFAVRASVRMLMCTSSTTHTV
jgi:hypothetical protein